MSDKQTGANTSSHEGLATASMVLGILAIVFGIIGIGVLLGILAIVFGAVSIKGNKGKALTGIITGIFGILITIATVLFITVILPSGIDSLQTSQRDTQRKNDVTILVSDVIEYMSNNYGQLPDNEWVSGMTYKLDAITSTTTGAPTDTSATYVTGQDCDGTASQRNFALTILLEDNTTYCQGS